MENSKKQTAVNFLHSEYKKLFGDFDVDIAKIQMMSNILEQAEEVFKQQIIESFWKGDLNGIREEHLEGEQYYNETFKK